MRKVVKFISIILLWLVAASSYSVFGQSYLNAADMRTLIVGNTVESHMLDGTQFQAFFDPSGKWVRRQGGQITEGTWRINDDGTQCVAVGGGESCAVIQKNDDRTYTRIVNGIPQLRWMKISAGKAF